MTIAARSNRCRLLMVRRSDAVVKPIRPNRRLTGS
jgi:hypothetical protein